MARQRGRGLIHYVATVLALQGGFSSVAHTKTRLHTHSRRGGLFCPSIVRANSDITRPTRRPPPQSTTVPRSQETRSPLCVRRDISYISVHKTRMEAAYRNKRKGDARIHSHNDSTFVSLWTWLEKKVGIKGNALSCYYAIPIRCTTFHSCLLKGGRSGETIPSIIGIPEIRNRKARSMLWLLWICLVKARHPNKIYARQSKYNQRRYVSTTCSDYAINVTILSERVVESFLLWSSVSSYFCWQITISRHK